MRKSLRLSLLLFVLNDPASAQGKAERWTPELMMEMKRVVGTTISSGANWIAYTVSTALTEGEKSEFLNHIWLVSADGKTNAMPC